MPIYASDGTQLDTGVALLAKAIRTTESNNNYNAVGDGGQSHGAYQFNKNNFSTWAGQYLGDPNAPMNPVNQDKVAYSRILDLKNQGYTPEQVASIWNSGKPDYQGNIGTNAQGIKYDVPKYVNSVISKYQQFAQGVQGGLTLPNPSNPAEQPQGKSVGGFIGNIFGSAGNLIGGLANTVLHPIQTLQGIGQAVTHPAQIWDALKQRYGGIKNIENTLYTDPVGVALDVSTLLGGVGLLGKAGAEGSSLARIGELAAKGSEATNPLAMIGKGISKTAGGIKSLAQASAGLATGEGTQAIKIAEQSAKIGGDAQSAFRGAMAGADTPEQILQDAQSGYQSIAKARGAEYQNKLSQIKEADHTLNMDSVAPLRNDFEKQLTQLDITKNPDGTLNFTNSILDSDPRAKRIVEQLDNKILKVETAPNPIALDNIKRFASDAYKPQDPLNAITQVTKNTARDILNTNVPKYAEMTKGYSEASQTLQDIKDALSIGGKAKQETILTKIMGSLNKGRTNRMAALEQLGGNKYLAERVAGYKLRQVIPGGLAGRVAEAGGLGLALHPAAIPTLGSALLGTSPRLMGEISQLTGLSERGASALIQGLQKVTGLQPAQLAQLLAQTNRVAGGGNK